MKKNVKKLSIEKFQISKLNNPSKSRVFGGTGDVFGDDDDGTKTIDLSGRQCVDK